MVIKNDRDFDELLFTLRKQFPFEICQKILESCCDIELAVRKNLWCIFQCLDQNKMLKYIVKYRRFDLYQEMMRRIQKVKKISHPKYERTYDSWRINLFLLLNGNYGLRYSS